MHGQRLNYTTNLQTGQKQFERKTTGFLLREILFFCSQLVHRSAQKRQPCLAALNFLKILPLYRLVYNVY
jgi:hypothetical protein